MTPQSLIDALLKVKAHCRAYIDVGVLTGAFEPIDKIVDEALEDTSKYNALNQMTLDNLLYDYDEDK
jgi:hypothetical protein